MIRSHINPLAAEEDDFVSASATELGSLANLVKYILQLESKDKTLNKYSHGDFIRAVYLSASASDRDIFKDLVNGT